jgi:hypothetical protein
VTHACVSGLASRGGWRHIAGAEVGCQYAVIADLVGTGRWNERDPPLQKLVAFDQDVRRPVPPAGLVPQDEPSVAPHFQAIVYERGPGEIAAEPLEPAPVAIGEDRKTHFPRRHRFFDPGACSRSGWGVSS